MKSISLKKVLSSIVSMVVITGMAIQSFATNVDMAAFVNKDKYMTKYYELDWRIDEIDRSLERMYKFVCTNLRSYGGPGGSSYQCNLLYNDSNTSRGYAQYQLPIAELSENNYLRVNGHEALTAFTGHTKTDILTKEYPASLAIWRDGVELYPETKIIVSAQRTWKNSTTDINQNSDFVFEWVMGPFKKFPHITSTGYPNGILFVQKDVFFGLYNSSGAGEFSYQYGTRTKPTSWRTMATGAVNYTSTDANEIAIFPGVNFQPSLEDFSNNIYSGGRRASTFTSVNYISTVFGTNLSSYSDIWLRFYRAPSSTYTSIYDAYDYNITTWNTNK